MKTVAFVDDDERELRRFEKALGPYFHVVTGLGYSQCADKLVKSGKARPDLWVLDLYFPGDGVVNSSAQRDEMNAKYQQLEGHTREFKSFLEGIGQGIDGGIELLRKCVSTKSPVVSLTRKGTLEDSIKCVDNGARMVFKKPGPSSLAVSGCDLNSAFDEAMESSARYLKDKFEEAISASSHWERCKHVYTFFLGILVSILIKELSGYSIW